MNVYPRKWFEVSARSSGLKCRLVQLIPVRREWRSPVCVEGDEKPPKLCRSTFVEAITVVAAKKKKARFRDGR